MATLHSLLSLAKNVTLLSTSNADEWSNWKDDVLRMVLNADGQSSKIVTGVTLRPSDADAASKWDQLDSQATSVIMALTNRDCRNIYKDQKTSAEMWAALVAYFEKSTFSSRSATRLAYHRLSHDPSKPIKIYLDSLDDMRIRLQALLPSGEIITDSYHKDIMLQNLHPSYEVWKTSLLAQPAGEPDLKTCRSVLEATMVDFNVDQRADEMLEGMGAGKPSPSVEPAMVAYEGRRGKRGNQNGSGLRGSTNREGGGRGGGSGNGTGNGGKGGVGHQEGQGLWTVMEIAGAICLWMVVIAVEVVHTRLPTVSEKCQRKSSVGVSIVLMTLLNWFTNLMTITLFLISFSPLFPILTSLHCMIQELIFLFDFIYI